MLLTADDLHRRGHYRNADRTLERLLALGVIPIVNENDTVATHEIRFGDNDRLAALVAHLVHADALVLLTDVDGLYTGKPGRPGAEFIARGRVDGRAGRRRRQPRRQPRRVGRHDRPRSTPRRSRPARASRSCCPRPRASATRCSAAAGTLFHAAGERSASRLFWLRHATTPRGRLVLDAGAVAAIVAAAQVAAAGRRHRRAAATSTPASRSTWSIPTACAVARGPGRLRRRRPAAAARAPHRRAAGRVPPRARPPRRPRAALRPAALGWAP